MSAEADALSKFDFDTVTPPSLYLKFKPGEPVTVRVLTVDPIVTNESFEDRTTKEQVSTTKFSFIVYNWTIKKAQILKATPNMAKQIGELHTDEDFGADIRKIDLKVTPPNKGEIKAYEIKVLQTAKDLTNDIVKECAAIKLDEQVKGDRMSFYKPQEPVTDEEEGPGHAKARQTAANIGNKDEGEEEVIEDIGDEPINMNDIPF